MLLDNRLNDQELVDKTEITGSLEKTTDLQEEGMKTLIQKTGIVIFAGGGLNSCQYGY